MARPSPVRDKSRTQYQLHKQQNWGKHELAESLIYIVVVNTVLASLRSWFPLHWHFKKGINHFWIILNISTSFLRKTSKTTGPLFWPWHFLTVFLFHNWYCKLLNQNECITGSVHSFFLHFLHVIFSLLLRWYLARFSQDQREEKWGCTESPM